MNPLFLAIALCLTCFCAPVCGEPTAPATAPTPLIDTNWSNPALTFQPTGHDRANGTLPAPWQDNTQWAQTWVDYSTQTENAASFLRMKVTRIDQGWGQMRLDLPAPRPNDIYTLTLRVRGTPGLPVSCGVRDADQPYNFHWQTALALSATWQDLSYDFRLTKVDQAVSFMIVVNNIGTLDLARIKLTAASPADFAAIAQARHPEGEPRNLLAQTCFPLGLQSGWSLVVDQGAGSGEVDSEVTTAPDAAVTGPSGVPALHITAPQSFQLYSAPFGVTQVASNHVVSAYLRGQGGGDLMVFQGGAPIGRKGFVLQPADGWQRIEVPFRPDPLGRDYVMRVSAGAHSELWLDAVQVESGSAATPYVTQKPCEVALSTSGPGNVQFVDQPPSVTWAAVNVPAGARLRSCSVNLYSRNLALLDLYGGVTQLRDIPLKSGALESGQLNYLPDSPNELGVHRLEAWVAGADGTELSPRVEIVINRIHRPRYWNADAPNSPFGTHLESNSRDILAAKAIGMNWTRLHDAGLEYIGWYYLEPQKGNWQFRDADLNRYRKYGLKIMGELSTAPLWASTLTTQHNGYFDKFYEPKNLDDYANYVRTVTARYKGVIDTYEIWNEPWGSGYFPVAYDASAGTGDDEQRAYKHSATPELDYANLMKSAYAAAKVADPSVTILGFNTTTGDTGKNWTQGVLDGGGLDGCDVISYHHYFGGASAFPGDQVEEGYAHAFGPITAKLGQIPKPVVLSEGNGVIGLPQGDGFYNHTLPYPNTEPVEQVADDLCRYEVSLLGLGVKRTFLYTMASRNFFGQDLKWSVLLNADDSLSPSAAAFSNLAWLLEDTQFVRRDEIAPGVYAYLFQGTLAGHPRAVAVISRRPGQGQYTLPLAKSVSFTDLWGNPVTTGTSLGDTLDYAELAGPGETVDTLSKDLRVPTHD